jgi:hypothetical protein
MRELRRSPLVLVPAVLALMVVSSALVTARPQDPVQQDPPQQDVQQPPQLDAQQDADKEKEKDKERRDGRRSRRRVNLNDEWRKAFFDWILAHPAVVQRSRGHRLAGVRVTLEEVTDASKTETIATFVLFDHTAGEARRVEVDSSTGEVISDAPIEGHPQSSREEFNEAVEVIRRDVEIGRLLADGAVVDGGFIVEAPDGPAQRSPDTDPSVADPDRGRPSAHRLIQLKVLSPDRFTLLRTIVVDLTDSVVVSSGTAP